MTPSLTAKAVLAICLAFPTIGYAHSLDICAPRVTLLDPSTTPAAIAPHAFIAQASLFLARVPETELREAVDGVPAGVAAPSTYLFSGSDTRWRLKSPLPKAGKSSNGAIGLPDQKHFLVPASLTKPYGTIVVSGTEIAADTLVNPSMVAHLADGRGIVIEARDLDAVCTLDLNNVEAAFLDGVAYHFEHQATE